jgi:hypothetical protein
MLGVFAYVDGQRILRESAGEALTSELQNQPA